MMEIDLQFHILTLNRSRDGKLLKLEDKEGLGQHIRYWNGKSSTCFYATTNKFNALAEDIFYQVGKRNVDTSRDMYVEKRQLASIMSGVLDRHKREEENERIVFRQLPSVNNDEVIVVVVVIVVVKSYRKSLQFPETQLLHSS